MYMTRRICAVITVLIAVPCWCQVEPSAEGTGYAASDDSSRMIMPPVVSGDNLPLNAERGQKVNYLSGGVALNTAYISNVQPGETAATVNDESYSIWPTVILDQRSPRALRLLNYNSGFTFYQHTNALDSINQSIDADFEFGVTPRLAVGLKDSFRQNSNVFNQPILNPEAVQSKTGPDLSGLVIPFDDELKNETSALFGYQFAKFAMVGGRTSVQLLKFPKARQGSGLYNSRAESVLGYYSRRISLDQYVGGFYERANVETSQQKTATDTQTVSVFYTFYSSRGFTFSLAAGPQYLEFTVPKSPSYSQWTPSVRASAGWQGVRARLTADYSRDVTAGQGLLGAFASDSADLGARVQLTRSWVLNTIGVYENSKDSVPNSFQGVPGGHSLSGTASAGYSLGEHLVAGAGYTHLHQSYGGIAELSRAPDSERVFLSMSYFFRRPLGR